MSKKLGWFKTSQSIPDTAKYIKSKIVRENYRELYPECGCPAMLGCSCATWDNVQYHLYEVEINETRQNIR